MFRPSAALASVLLLAGCGGQQFDPWSGASRLGGASFPRPVLVAGPPGCAGPIVEYQKVIDNDAETGHLNPGVYNRISTDLEPVKEHCANAREAEARNQLAAVKRRYGYR